MFYHFAVVGSPVAHSLSPIIHQCFAEQFNIQLRYEAIQGDEQSFEQQVSDFFSHGGKGLNITLPFKQRAFALAQIKTSRCELSGAANTLWMQDKKLAADNTDGIGFIRDVIRYIDPDKKKILILGAGGAARGIIGPLLAAKPESLLVANRTVEKVLELQKCFPLIECSDLNSIKGEFDLVINATSTSLQKECVFFPMECLTKKTVCYDLAYKQNQSTAFVAHCQSLGCIAVDGLGMLVEQAAEAFSIWHGVTPSTAHVLSFLRRTD